MPFSDGPYTEWLLCLQFGYPTISNCERECFWCVQLNPGNSKCQGKLKLLRVIGVSSCRGFEQKDQKHLIKVVLCLYMFYCMISSGNERA